MMRSFGQLLALLVLAALAPQAAAQVIRFESGGLEYQTLTKGGITVMFAHLPTTIRDYSILQVAVSNGSGETATVRPEDFIIEMESGGSVRGVPAVTVIRQLIQDASGEEVIKMVTAYEMGIYGFGNRLTNSYERRRQSALAVVSSKRLKAAAAASAIAFVETELRPGGSTDGALFYPNFGRAPGQVTLQVRLEGEVFQFLASNPIAER